MNQYTEELKAKESKSKDLNLLQLLESRITEIVQLEKEIKKKYPKLFHQRLPRFMRRRAASHNPKRIPKFKRPKRLEVKDRGKLLAYRQKTRHLKHKRVLKRRHVYKDRNKSVLHKWFAKRFKIERRKLLGLEQVPLHNNTKNQRNLYRQSLYGCAYLSLAHLIAVRVDFKDVRSHSDTLNELDKLTYSISGFTFSAQALKSDRYEVVIHLFRQSVDDIKFKYHKTKKLKLLGPGDYICPCYVTKHDTHLIMWLPRSHVDQVIECYQASTSLNYLQFTKINPCDWVRIRLIGPKAREEALRIVQDEAKHNVALDELDNRVLLSHQFGVTLGRCIDENDACFTYYQSNPLAVDIVFRKKAGRLLWYQLIKNKAHLVGGKRDVEVLLQNNRHFSLVPDHFIDDDNGQRKKPESNSQKKKTESNGQERKTESNSHERIPTNKAEHSTIQLE